MIRMGETYLSLKYSAIFYAADFIASNIIFFVLEVLYEGIILNLQKGSYGYLICQRR